MNFIITRDINLTEDRAFRNLVLQVIYPVLVMSKAQLDSRSVSMLSLSRHMHSTPDTYMAQNFTDAVRIQYYYEALLTTTTERAYLSMGVHPFRSGASHHSLEMRLVWLAVLSTLVYEVKFL